MPFINRVRLVNVHFNNATQFYDDFKLDFGAGSGTFQLRNGGGKSLLIMMLMQTVIPGQHFKPEKPVKDIFSGGTDRTSHVLVEWELDEGHPYKYLLTGFCARRARNNEEDEVERLGMEYFNYAYFYNESNSNDINRIPLYKIEDSKKHIMNFGELKQHLKTIRQSVPVETFNNKSEYREFLSNYQIFEAEWMVLKNINIRENNLANFFREQKGSRTLIENFLVDTIDKTVYSRDKVSSGAIATMLMDMKDNIQKLQQLSTSIEEIEVYKHGLKKVSDANETLKDSLAQADLVSEKIMVFINTLRRESEINEKEKNKTIELINSERVKLREVTQRLKSLEIYKHDAEIKVLEEKKKAIMAESEEHYKSIEGGKNKTNFMRAVNKYLKWVEKKNDVTKTDTSINTMKMSNKEVYDNVQTCGNMLYPLLWNHIKKSESEISVCNSEITRLKAEEKTNKEKLSRQTNLLGRFEQSVERLTKELSNARKNHDNLCRVLEEEDMSLFISMDVEREIILIKEALETLKDKLGETEEAKKKLDIQLQEYKTELGVLNEKIKQSETKQSEVAVKFKSFEKAKEELTHLKSLYGASNIEELTTTLKAMLEENRNAVGVLISDKERTSRELEIIQTHGVYLEEQRIIEVEEMLKKSYPFVQLGSQYLKELSKEERKTKLELFPLLPYSLLLYGDDFDKLKKSPAKLNKFTGLFIPIINMDSVRKHNRLDDGNILFPIKNNIFILESIEDISAVKSKLEGLLAGFNQKIDARNEEYVALNKYIDQTKYFERDFIDESGPKINELKNAALSEHKKLVSERDALLSLKNSADTEITQCVKVLLETDKTIKEKSSRLSLLEQIKELDKTIKTCNDELNQEEKNKSDTKATIKQLESEEERYKIEIEERSDWLRKAKQKNTDDDRELETLSQFKSSVYICKENDSLDEIRSIYAGYNNHLRREEKGLDELEGRRAELQKDILDIEKDIVNLNSSIETLKDGDYRVPFSEESIRANDDLVAKEEVLFTKTTNEKNTQQSNIDRRLGQKERAIKDYEHLYGEFIPEEEFDKIEAIIESIRQKEIEKTSLDKQIGTLEAKERQMKNVAININKELGKAEVYKKTINISTETNAVDVYDSSLTFDELQNQHNERNEKCEKIRKDLKKDIASIVKQAKNFRIYGYGDILEDMVIPATTADALKTSSMLEAHMRILDDSVSKLKHDYENNSKERDNFVDQLVALGTMVCGHVKRLNTLSKIAIDGLGKKEMVKIELELFEPEKQRNNMAQHIDKLISRVEKEKLSKEDVAFELTSKVLLSQVADTKKARVELFKYEEIKENSGYVRWEKAVESDGQTNMLYFMFLATIISFIRNLSGSSEDGESRIGSKKVIILDNPFGTTSAIYLWNPIAEMLKQNNFQLIASGHKINGNVMPLFKTNHQLDHEILSGGIQKVVVDFKGQAKGHNLMGEAIVEQESLFDE